MKKEMNIVTIKSDTPFFAQYEKEILDVIVSPKQELVLIDCDGNRRFFPKKGWMKKKIQKIIFVSLFRIYSFFHRLKLRIGVM